MENNEKKMNFSVFEQNQIEIPEFIERKSSGKDFMYWGDKNKMPYYLYHLYEKSALMNSIVNTSVSFVLGNEIKSDLIVVNKKGESLQDFISDITLDYLIYGGFAFQIIYNGMNEINELYWMDMRKVRVDEDLTKVYYSKEFDKKSNPVVIEYDIWKPGDNRGSKVFYFNGTNRSVYPVPRYSGSLLSIETSIEIANYHYNAIHNNFNGNFIISFNNGIPDDETQHTVEKQIKEKFCGSTNASRFMLAWNDSKDNAVSVEKIPDDNSDKKYEQLFKSTMQSIFTGFAAPQQLFGYALDGNVFNKNEYQEAFDLYSRLQITPIQNMITTIFNKIYGVDNKIEFVPFALSENENTENIEDAQKLNPDVNE